MGNPRGGMGTSFTASYTLLPLGTGDKDRLFQDLEGKT